MDIAFIFRLDEDTAKDVSMALARTNFIFNYFHCIFKAIIYNELNQMFYETQ